MRVRWNRSMSAFDCGLPTYLVRCSISSSFPGRAHGVELAYATPADLSKAIHPMTARARSAERSGVGGGAVMAAPVRDSMARSGRLAPSVGRTSERQTVDCQGARRLHGLVPK